MTGILPSEFLARLRMTPYDWFMTTAGNLAPGLDIWRTEDMDAFAKRLAQKPIRTNITPTPERIDLDWSDADLKTIRTRFDRELRHYPERPIHVPPAA
jgi:hypothetical protein